LDSSKLLISSLLITMVNYYLVYYN